MVVVKTFEISTLGILIMTELQLTKERNIHIIGGGGVGMSALGMLLLHSGYCVSASDKNGGKYLQKLGEAGALVWTGSDPQKIPQNSIVFYSSAVPSNDVERAWAESQNLEIHSRHNLLKFISSQYHTIAVSGTHGKTTTTGWIAFLLEKAGLDPSAIVGGTLVQWDSNIRLGKGTINDKKILVIEADESDESFLFLNAKETIVTNIELDHVDNYTNLEHVQNQFIKFIENCQKNQGVFFPSYEVQNLQDSGMNDYDKIKSIAMNIFLNEPSQSLVYKMYPEKIFKIGLAGVHNLWNAFAVLLFGIYHNIPDTAIAQALEEYRGVERRMQVLGNFSISNSPSFRIIDDYAHHPTEIKMVLETLAKTNRPRLVIWEPHRISRFLHFNDEFRDVLQKNPGLDNLILINVFDAAGEKQMPQFSGFDMVWKKWTAEVYGVIEKKGNFEIICEFIKEKNSDIDVVFLGAGNSSDFAHDFAASCKEFKV